MVLFIVALGWLGVIGYVLYRAVAQFRSYESIVAGYDIRDEALPSISVIVPARNEAGNIASCLHALANQHYPSSKMDITVVDDNPIDSTAEIVESIAEARSCVKLLRGNPLPAGWAGKAHACYRGACASKSDWLCFMDADTVAYPNLLRAAVAVAFAESEKIDMLSLEPFQELVTFWERVVLPAGLFVMAFVLPDLGAINDPNRSEATANGQFILIRRNTYNATGGHGHESVRNDIHEDKAVARTTQGGGYRTCLLGGERLLRVRMYTSWNELWQGGSRNAAGMVESTRTLLLAASVALVIAWGSVVLPVWACSTVMTPSGSNPGMAGAVLVLLGTLAVFCTHIAEARYFRIPFWYGFLFPFGLTIIAGIGINVLKMRSSGITRWKGRLYAPSEDVVDVNTGLLK